MNRGDVAWPIDALSPSGGTATGDALATALRSARAPGRPATASARRRAIVLLSDGDATHGRDPIPVARRAARRKIPVYTVALGTASGARSRSQRVTARDATQVGAAGPETLRRIAHVERRPRLRGQGRARARHRLRAARVADRHARRRSARSRPPSPGARCVMLLPAA